MAIPDGDEPMPTENSVSEDAKSGESNNSGVEVCLDVYKRLSILVKKLMTKIPERRVRWGADSISKLRGPVQY